MSPLPLIYYKSFRYQPYVLLYAVFNRENKKRPLCCYIHKRQTLALCLCLYTHADLNLTLFTVQPQFLHPRCDPPLHPRSTPSSSAGKATATPQLPTPPPALPHSRSFYSPQESQPPHTSIRTIYPSETEFRKLYSPLQALTSSHNPRIDAVVAASP